MGGFFSSSESDDNNIGLRGTVGGMEYRNSVNRFTFRESLKKGRLLSIERRKHQTQPTETAQNVPPDASTRPP